MWGDRGQLLLATHWLVVGSPIVFEWQEAGGTQRCVWLSE
jgi:hypothetical protein